MCTLDPWSVSRLLNTASSDWASADQPIVIQASNSNTAPPARGAAELIAIENSTVRSHVHDYAHHNFP